jgi:hypothetical protein
LADIDPTSVLSISRASTGYATNADGTLTSFGTGILRITDLGLLIEDARTNVVLWNRDLSNAAWIKTNITAAKDQTGVDGGANAASSLLATAANGTALQAITLASAAAFQSAYVKRLIGTGTINMTMDNGATWTVIAPTSNWTLLSIPTQTLANPTVGFRIVTNGDKIAVDFVQNENGAFGSSPISTTTTSATRAADSVTCASSLDTVLSTLPYSVVMDLQSTVPPIGYNWVFLGDTNNVRYPFYSTNDASADIRATAYPGLASGNFLGATKISTGAKMGNAGASGARSIVGGGGTVASDATTTVMASGSCFLGGIGGSVMFGYIRRLTAWSSKLADATLQALTAP